MYYHCSVATRFWTLHSVLRLADACGAQSDENADLPLSGQNVAKQALHNLTKASQLFLTL
jgi:hypothetical protein